jgi:hypothetical protein
MKDLINIEGEKVYVRIDGKKKEIKGRTKAEKLKNARTYINLMRSPTTKKHPDVKTAIEAFREILQVKTAQVGKKPSTATSALSPFYRLTMALSSTSPSTS